MKTPGQMEGEKDQLKDGETLSHKTLPANAGGSIKLFACFVLSLPFSNIDRQIDR